MKFRLVMGTAALSALLFVSSTFAQQPTPNPGQGPQTSPAPPDPHTTTTPPTSTPPTLPPTTAPSDSDTKKDDPAKQPSVVQQPDDSKVKHDGSKNDVNAIGNRKVGGRGLGDWYSLEGEIRMGKQYAQEVEATSKLIRDPVITEYVNRIGQNLVRNSDAQVPFTIKVVDSDEVNAFALPGGFFYVNSRLILAADEE